MSQTSVVILSGRSLFAEGVASRLRQHLERFKLHTVDSRQDDALAQVVAVRPSAVILDASDPNVTDHCPLNTLLEALPSLKIIRLDPQRNQVQVVTSEQRQATEVSDLISLIEPHT